MNMISLEALKPLIVSYPCKIGEHDIESTILVEGEDGEPKKKRVFSKHFSVHVPYTRQATPNDIAEDAARRNEEHDLAKREGREPAYVSRIFSDNGIAMVSEPGSGAFQVPEDMVANMVARELVRVVGPAQEMANALASTAAPRRKSLAPART